jgi:acyl-CoA synthetase (NDP forming)
VQGPAEAGAAARSIDRPVAIKVVSPDILHKTEVGGVALGVLPEAAAACVEAMMAKVSAAMPDADVAGYLISPMVSGGTECIVGAHNDPVLGPVIMFGLGGVTVELMKDVTTRLAPVTEQEALELVRSVKGFPLLDGFRGRKPADVFALARVISVISRLAAANADTVRTIEVNPLLVLDAGEGVLALDAVIET